MGAVSEKLVAKSVVSLELSLDFSLPESSVYSTLRRKDDSVLATGLLCACSVATEVISARPGQGALQARCHQRLLVQPFCSEVTLSRENPSLTPTCMSPVLRSPSIAPRGQGNIGERQRWAHGTERSLPISQQVVAAQT